ncbi:MAG: urea ABC transporter ATP-binding subunit UrtE [Verrucomicrobia bacterium]|nr:urea ABC transporter ATP-binding subunit UrtE [Verrucomicrobiota bacterium]
MLDVKNISFSYGEVEAVRSVALCVQPGEMVSVMGRNGVGKTTLMKTIVGVLRPKSGLICLNDQDVSRRQAYGRVRRGIGYVPQGRMIFPRLTIEENLQVALSARQDKLRTVPDFVFDMFPVLKDMEKRMGGDLSGGQQQQLAIARALVTNPKVLILDEPTEGIQPNIIQHIGEVLKTLVNEMNLAVLIVEQYLDFVREYSQRFYVMNRGEMVASGKTETLTEDIVKNYLSV